MGFKTILGSQAVTTSNATLGSAVPTGQIWRIVAVNLQQPATADAKTVALAIGTTATAANVKRRYSLTGGLATAQDFPDIPMVAGDQVNVVGDGTTAQAVITVTVEKELVS
jgi:hypothetical protein